jgi:hypothetical protein
MASSEQKIQALEVHLPYELLMLRCAYRQIQSERNQLAWNMTLETFVLHARILEVFLTNGDDNRNFNAKDFSSTFAAKKDQSVHRKVRNLIERVFHLGKQRVPISDGKGGKAWAEEIYGWIEKTFQRFVDSLDEELVSHWTPDRAKLETFLVVRTGNAPPSATNEIFSVSTTI